MRERGSELFAEHRARPPAQSLSMREWGPKRFERLSCVEMGQVAPHGGAKDEGGTESIWTARIVEELPTFEEFLSHWVFIRGACVIRRQGEAIHISP